MRSKRQGPSRDAVTAANDFMQREDGFNGSMQAGVRIG
jgi:hypothetical protein